MERKGKKSFWERKWVLLALFLLTGALSGFVGGTLGAGGGVILVFALGALLPKYAQSCESKSAASFPDFDRRDVFASTVVVSLASSLLSACLYIKKGALDIRDALPFLPGAAIGGIAGGLMLGRFSSDTVRWIFAVITAVAGGIMLFL